MAQSVVTYLASIRTLRALNTSTTVPLQLSTLNAGSATFRKAVVYGLKASQTNNTGTVYLGGPQDTANGSQFIPVTAGGSITIEAPVGQHYDWSQFWLDVANAGDGVIAYYS